MEENKLIAEFMGMQNTDIGWYDNDEVLQLQDNTFDDLEFHKSWDWLMPVVEKIRNVTSYDRDRFNTEVIICGNKTTIKSGGYGEKKHSNFFFNKTVLGAWNTKEATYKAVVEFIKWYNAKK